MKNRKKYNKPVIAFCGKIGEGIDTLYDKGIDSIFGITKQISTIRIVYIVVLSICKIFI